MHGVQGPGPFLAAPGLGGLDLPGPGVGGPRRLTPTGLESLAAAVLEPGRSGPLPRLRDDGDEGRVDEPRVDPGTAGIRAGPQVGGDLGGAGVAGRRALEHPRGAHVS